MKSVSMIDIYIFVTEEGLHNFDLVLMVRLPLVRVVNVCEAVEEGRTVVLIQTVHSNPIVKKQPA